MRGGIAERSAGQEIKLGEVGGVWFHTDLFMSKAMHRERFSKFPKKTWINFLSFSSQQQLGANEQQELHPEVLNHQLSSPHQLHQRSQPLLPLSHLT